MAVELTSFQSFSNPEDVVFAADNKGKHDSSGEPVARTKRWVVKHSDDDVIDILELT